MCGCVSIKFIKKKQVVDQVQAIAVVCQSLVYNSIDPSVTNTQDQTYNIASISRASQCPISITLTTLLLVSGLLWYYIPSFSLQFISQTYMSHTIYIFFPSIISITSLVHEEIIVHFRCSKEFHYVNILTLIFLSQCWWTFDGHFHVLTPINYASISILAHVSGYIYECISFGHIFRNRIVEYALHLYFNR